MFPATGYLFLAWETLAISKGIFYFDFAVQFEDIKFLRATTLSKDSEVEFTIIVQPGTGRFEISEGMSTLVSGYVKTVDKVSLTEIKRKSGDKTEVLLNKDFYKELRLRGYHYNGLFRSVQEATGDGLYGKVKWDSNWIAFLDCLLQIQILGQDTRSLILPTSIQKITIDTLTQLEMVRDFEEDADKIFEVFVSPELKMIRSGGIEVVNLQANVVGRRRPPGIPVLEYYKYIPYHQTPTLDRNNAARMLVQLAIENIPIAKVKAVEIDGLVRNSILPEIRDAVGDLPLVTSDLTCLSARTLEEESDVNVENVSLSTHTGCYFIISSNCINDIDLFEKATSSFGEHGFLVCRENLGVQLGDIVLPETYSMIASINTEDETLIVLRFVKKVAPEAPDAIHITESNFDWIDAVKAAMKKGSIVLVAENEPLNGLIGLVNCLRKEPDGLRVQCLFIDDPKAHKFSLDDPFYQNQLKLRLAINVLKNGTWGCFRHFQIEQNFAERSVLDHCYVNSLIKSDLSSLKWISGPFNYSRPKGELVKVQYAALNFRDVMLATGKLSADVFAENRMEHECVLGIEYSGVTTSGKRVMGMTLSAAMVIFAILF